MRAVVLGAGLAPVSPAEGAIVAGPLRLVWTAVPDVQEHHVDNATPSGDLALAAMLGDTALTVPPGARLAPGVR